MNPERYYYSGDIALDNAEPEKIARTLQSVIQQFSFSVYAFKVTHRQLLTIVPMPLTYVDNIIRLNLSHNFAPRTFHYPSNYKWNPELRDHDDGRFYQFTKLYKFLTTPFDGFRVPFSVGRYKQNLSLHPGTFRSLAMQFVPIDFTCYVLVTDYQDNYTLIKNFKNYCLDYFCVNDASQDTIIKEFQLEKYRHASVQIFDPVGIQLVEFHPCLDEYKMDYTVHFTGNELFVNDVCVAWLNKKIDLFVIPKELIL